MDCLQNRRHHLHSLMNTSSTSGKPMAILCQVFIRTRFGLPTDRPTWAKQYTLTSLKGGIIITAEVFIINLSGSCALFESKCSNGRCIHGDLNCNGYNPCGDFSDCDGDRSEGSYLGIIIGSCSAVFTFTVVIVFIVVFIKCKRRRSPGQQGHVVSGWHFIQTTENSSLSYIRSVMS